MTDDRRLALFEDAARRTWFPPGCDRSLAPHMRRGLGTHNMWCGYVEAAYAIAHSLRGTAGSDFMKRVTG